MNNPGPQFVFQETKNSRLDLTGVEEFVCLDVLRKPERSADLLRLLKLHLHTHLGNRIAGCLRQHILVEDEFDAVE